MLIIYIFLKATIQIHLAQTSEAGTCMIEQISGEQRKLLSD